jgi:simple sugar transport system permease protein
MIRGFLETLFITLAALVTSLVLFGIFIFLYQGVAPQKVYYWMFVGSFGTAFSWQNTLTKAAPLILTALCTALPARLGLIVIGGEGALVLGGLAAVAVGLVIAPLPGVVGLFTMAVVAMGAGGLFIAFAGYLSHRRGVNITISSLLLTYIAIAFFNFVVEDPRLMRDPASLNKPSTSAITENLYLGNIPGMDVHWGLVFGIVLCFLAYLLMDHTTFGFSARMAGGNLRAAQAAGLPVGWLVSVVCLLGGAAAGLAGMVEIAANEHKANATIIAGYGYTGILVSFIGRHHPIAIIPAAVLFGGISASSGVLQRYLQLHDASVQVLMGIIFVCILSFETLYGRLGIFQPPEMKKKESRA